MERGYGHASIAGPAGRRDLRTRALFALHGVGAPRLGQWDEWTGRAFHLRRRLSLVEEAEVGSIIDIRGTPEADARLAPLRSCGLLPATWRE